MAASIHRYPRVEKSAGFWDKRNIPWDYHGMSNIPGGWGGIRTPGRVAPSAVFKTVAFDRSATHPKLFLFPPVFQTCGFVRTALRAHHSFARGGVPLALLTHKQDRRYCPALPPIRNGFWRLPALLFSAVALYIFFLYFATVKSESYFVFCACAILAAHIFA